MAVRMTSLLVVMTGSVGGGSSRPRCTYCNAQRYGMGTTGRPLYKLSRCRRLARDSRSRLARTFRPSGVSRSQHRQHRRPCLPLLLRGQEVQTSGCQGVPACCRWRQRRIRSAAVGSVGIGQLQDVSTASGARDFRPLRHHPGIPS